MILYKAMLVLSSVWCVYNYKQFLAMILLFISKKNFLEKKIHGQILAKAFGKKLPLSHVFVNTVFPKY